MEVANSEAVEPYTYVRTRLWGSLTEGALNGNSGGSDKLKWNVPPL